MSVFAEKPEPAHAVRIDTKLTGAQINVLGSLAVFGALVSMSADVVLGWTPDRIMTSAFSLDIETVRMLLAERPRWTFVLGSALGVAFIPFHLPGFFLAYLALRQAGEARALIFLIGAVYFVAIGTGYHGTFAFIADTLQSGQPELLTLMLDYWSMWGLFLSVGYIALCVYLVTLIIRGTTLYPRWAVTLTPLPIVGLTAVAITLLPGSASSIQSFLAVTGLNFPLLVFHIFTWRTLRKQVAADAGSGS